MQIHSLTILHYGADYLNYALKSVYPHIDKAHVFYTSTPSHGHSTSIPPVESRDALMREAFRADAYESFKGNGKGKVIWHDLPTITHEGPQRDFALQQVRKAGADMVVVVDCDEIWPDGLLPTFINYARANKARNHLVNMMHFWRSFNWACQDQGWPVRIIDLREDEAMVNYIPADLGRVLHFGYAVRDRVMRYKWLIHGHKNELRPEWFMTKWAAWPPVDDCHPTNGRNDDGEPFWTPKPFDKATLPEFMREHRFYGADRIE